MVRNPDRLLEGQTEGQTWLTDRHKQTYSPRNRALIGRGLQSHFLSKGI